MRQGLLMCVLQFYYEHLPLRVGINLIYPSLPSYYVPIIVCPIGLLMLVKYSNWSFVNFLLNRSYLKDPLDRGVY